METVLENSKFVKNAIPALLELINKELGFAPELIVEVKSDRLQITSNDLMNELGNTLVKTIFKSIRINFGGGELSEDGNYFWFIPKLSYEHPNGGKNSTDFLWNGLWFDLQNNCWVTGHNILTLNQN